MNIEWVELETVLVAHADQIAEHGGSPGLRDEGALHSALARPQNLAAYGDPDLFRLAAAYAFGLARNHAFVDGNKRTAFVVSSAFLSLNGFELDADEADAADTFLKLAAGELTEDELAGWFRANSSPPDDAYLVPEQDQ
jgi:death-on-curing protein